MNRRRTLTAVSATALAFTLVGCGGDQPAAEVDQWTAWADELAAVAEARSDSPFIQEVLADGVITPEELHEASHRWADCLAEHGMMVALVEGGVSYSPPMDREADRACEAKYGAGILASYLRMIEQNPGNLDWDDGVAACFIREGIAPEGFTGRELRNIIDQHRIDYADLLEQQIIVEYDDDGNEIGGWLDPNAPEVPPVTLPDGTPLFSEETWACEADPFGTRQ